MHQRSYSIRRSRLKLKWVNVRGLVSCYTAKPPKQTQPGHPSLNKRDEHRQALATELVLAATGL